MTPTGYRLYQIHHSILSQQQILRYHQTRTTSNILSVLHIRVGECRSSSSHNHHHHDEATSHHPRQDESKKPTTIPTWTRRINAMLAHYVQHTKFHHHDKKNNNNGTVPVEDNKIRIHQLQIPFTLFGPLIPNNNNMKHCNHSVNHEESYQNEHTTTPFSSLLYIDDAIVGVLKALQQQHEQSSPSPEDVVVGHSSKMILSVSNLQRHEQQYMYQDQVYQQNELYPYGNFMTGTDEALIATSESSRQQYKKTIAEIYNFYGIYKTRFPCASTCWNEEIYNENDDICDASVLDTIHPISTSITKHCSYVMYYVNFDVRWNQMLDPPKPFMGVSPMQPSKLCRVAFVSSQSVVVQNLIQEQYHKKDKEKMLRDHNGKLVVNEWSLIWVNTDTTEETGSSSNLVEVDTLLRLEPSRFFASNVKKAMYTDSDIILTTSNVAILHIMSNINRPARPQGYHTNEYRSGLDNIHRPVYHPPSRARSVAFFASEMEDRRRPKNLGEYIQYHLSDMEESDIKKSRPINYYKQMSHWIQSDTNRPLRDGIGILLHIPWVWISMKFYVHNLHSDAARWFRCSWYDTYLYWGTERIPGTEDLSLAYLLAKHRLLGTIGPEMEDGSWLPLHYANNHLSFVDDDTESFVRVMSTDSL